MLIVSLGRRFCVLIIFAMTSVSYPIVEFSNSELALSVVKSNAIQSGHTAEVLRSKKSRNGQVRKIWLCCGHGRQYKDHRPDFARKRKTCSRKIGCPWLVIIQRNIALDGEIKWYVKPQSNIHNHPLTYSMA